MFGRKKPSAPVVSSRATCECGEGHTVTMPPNPPEGTHNFTVTCRCGRRVHIRVVV